MVMGLCGSVGGGPVGALGRAAARPEERTVLSLQFSSGQIAVPQALPALMQGSPS
jgi:hypothetical protein